MRRDCPVSPAILLAAPKRKTSGVRGRSPYDWVRKGGPPTRLPMRMRDESEITTLRGGDGPEFVALGATSRGGAVVSDAGSLPIRVVLRLIGGTPSMPCRRIHLRFAPSAGCTQCDKLGLPVAAPRPFRLLPP